MTTVETVDEGAVHGFLHRPASVSFASPVATLALTHGAGSNCDTVLLRAVADGFAAAGVQVLRFDLAFRVRRASGPPHPSRAAEDRAGIAEVIAAVRKDYSVPGPVLLGGHSYGGRQASMLAAENPGLVDGLVLLSYPLHPPKKPEKLRTEHLPDLNTPTVVVPRIEGRVRDNGGDAGSTRLDSRRDASGGVRRSSTRLVRGEISGGGGDSRGRIGGVCVLNAERAVARVGGSW